MEEEYVAPGSEGILEVEEMEVLPAEHSHRLFDEMELKSIAIGVSLGRSVSVICASTGLGPQQVERVLGKKGLRPHELELYEGFEAEAKAHDAVMEIRYRSEMSKMVDKCYATIDAVLGQTDKNAALAAETAWRVLRNAGAPVMGERTGDGGVTINTQMNYVNEASASAVQGAFDSLTETSKLMVASPLRSVTDPSPYKRVSEAETILDIADMSPPSEAPLPPDPQLEGTPE